jgi:hypothetical protein
MAARERLRPSRTAFSCLTVLAALVTLGCGDDASDETPVPGDPPGAVCESDEGCPDRAWLCFAVGSASSCDGGGLCSAVTNPDTGVPDELKCAQACKSDADCAAEATATTCLLGCATNLFNGHCVTPEAATELLEYEFCENRTSSVAIAGASYSSLP